MYYGKFPKKVKTLNCTQCGVETDWVLEMDNMICTCIVDTVCGDKIFPQTKADHQNEKSVWYGFRQFVETIGELALEILRSNNPSEPVFSNGGTRVLIRQDRIDLI